MNNNLTLTIKPMKNKKTSALIFCLSIVICYLAISFVKMELNPKNWSESLRVGLILFSPLISFLVLAIYQLISLD